MAFKRSWVRLPYPPPFFIFRPFVLRSALPEGRKIKNGGPSSSWSELISSVTTADPGSCWTHALPRQEVRRNRWQENCRDNFPANEPVTLPASHPSGAFIHAPCVLSGHRQPGAAHANLLVPALTRRIRAGSSQPLRSGTPWRRAQRDFLYLRQSPQAHSARRAVDPPACEKHEKKNPSHSASKHQ